MKNTVNEPEELLVGRVLLSEIINRSYDKIALVLLGGNMDLAKYREEVAAIRLYLFMKEGGEYVEGGEIGAIVLDG